jgi:dolichol kinase
MLHGKWPLRTNLEPDSAHRAGAVALFVLSGLVTWLLFRYFDPSTAVLGVPFLPEVNFPLIQKG